MEKKYEVTQDIEEELRIKQIAEFTHEIITRNSKFKKMWNTKVFSEEEKDKIREIGIKIEHELVNSIEELGFDDVDGDKSVLAAQLVSETMAAGYFNAVNQLGMKTRIDMGKEEEKEKKGDKNMIELVNKEDIMEKKHEVTPKIEEMLSNWIAKNGDSLRDVLQEIDEFLWDSIDSKEWSVGTDPEYVHDVVLFILNSQIKKREEEKEK